MLRERESTLESKDDPQVVLTQATARIGMPVTETGTLERLVLTWLV